MKTIILTAWMLVHSITPDTLPCGKPVLNYLFINDYKTYMIAFPAEKDLGFKRRGWYKIKAKMECEKVMTTELQDTGLYIIPIGKYVNFCNATEITYEKPNVSNCFYVGGVCYY